MTSVERILQYMDLPQEAAPILPEEKLPKSWPADGSIQFKNVYLKYSSSHQYSLKNISFIVKPGEKV